MADNSGFLGFGFDSGTYDGSSTGQGREMLSPEAVPTERDLDSFARGGSDGGRRARGRSASHHEHDGLDIGERFGDSSNVAERAVCDLGWGEALPDFGKPMASRGRAEGDEGKGREEDACGVDDLAER